MKSLLIMRHAKSSWKDTDIQDFDRPLNKRGRSDAPVMGQLLRDRELLPQRILSSTAVRARTTVESIVVASGYKGEIIYLDSFYMAEPITYLESLRLLSDDLERVMIMGHNPGLESLLQQLSRQVVALPTAAVAYLTLPIKHWAELKVNTEGELVEYWVPRDLPGYEVKEKHAEPSKKQKENHKDKKQQKEAGK
jgi:phosphohistidine phosphatase